MAFGDGSKSWLVVVVDVPSTTTPRFLPVADLICINKAMDANRSKELMESVIEGTAVEDDNNVISLALIGGWNIPVGEEERNDDDENDDDETIVFPWVVAHFDMAKLS